MPIVNKNNSCDSLLLEKACEQLLSLYKELLPSSDIPDNLYAPVLFSFGEIILAVCVYEL